MTTTMTFSAATARDDASSLRTRRHHLRRTTLNNNNTKPSSSSSSSSSRRRRRRRRTIIITRSFFNNNNNNNNNNKKEEEEDSGDFITNLVGKLFPGMLEDPEPAGLKRMTREEWPDQWPANCEAFLEPMSDIDDTRELRLVRRVLKQTQMESKRLGIAYDAETHGWSGSSFHTQLDGQGCGLLIAETTDGVVFGGYNPKGWVGYGEWADAISAFLFVYARGTKESNEVRENWRQRNGNHRRGG